MPPDIASISGMCLKKVISSTTDTKTEKYIIGDKEDGDLTKL